MAVINTRLLKANQTRAIFLVGTASSNHVCLDKPYKFINKRK